MKTLIIKIIAKYYKFFYKNEEVVKARIGLLKNIRFYYSKGIGGMFLGQYEKKIAREFKKDIVKSTVVYDVGAHIGFYTLLSSKYIKLNGTVYTFEPLPYNVNILKKLLNLNQISNVELFEIAVSDKNGEIEFSNTTNNAANTIIKESPVYSSTNIIKVQSNSLDELYAENRIKPPQLIKMDIEGAEYAALLGAKNILQKYHPVIYLSTHNCHIIGIHKKCINFLTDLGYQLDYFDFHKRQTELDDPWYELRAYVPK